MNSNQCGPSAICVNQSSCMCNSSLYIDAADSIPSYPSGYLCVGKFLQITDQNYRLWIESRSKRRYYYGAMANDANNR